jgi:hypothetical protein
MVSTFIPVAIALEMPQNWQCHKRTVTRRLIAQWPAARQRPARPAFQKAAQSTAHASCAFGSPADNGQKISWELSAGGDSEKYLIGPGGTMDVDTIFRQTFDPEIGPELNNQQRFVIICGRVPRV